MKTEWFLAKRYLFRGRARHISFIGVIACCGVAVGVAALIIVISVMNGFDRDLTSLLLKFNYHLTIEAENSAKLEKIKAVVAKWDDVDNASIFVQTQVFGKFGDVYLPLGVKGIDFNNEKEKKLFFSSVKQDFKREGFYAGDGLRRRFFVDDTLEYYPLDKKFVLKEDKLSGFFKVGVYDIDNNFLITDLAKAKSLSANYQEFLGVRINDPAKAGAIKDKISRVFGSGAYILTWIESNEVLFSALALEKIAMFIILSLIILVASFNIFATLTVKVVEKIKDIGVLKALGFTSRSILAIFSLQGLLLGMIGVFSGAILGVAVCLVLKEYHFIKLPASIYTMEYLPVALDAPDIILIIVLGILLAFFSSLAPALRASRMTPCDALRYE